MVITKALVLAGGYSRRMHANKLITNLHGMPIICHLLNSINQSIVNEVIVVTGYMAKELENHFGSHNLRTVYNPDFEKGMSTSIVAGIKNIMDAGNACDAVLIFNGDMPFIKPTTINALITTYDKTHAPAVVPYYDNKRGHPVLFDKKCFPKLLCLKGDVGARSILDSHKECIVNLEVTDPGIHIDIDTIEELDKFTK